MRPCVLLIVVGTLFGCALLPPDGLREGETVMVDFVFENASRQTYWVMEDDPETSVKPDGGAFVEACKPKWYTAELRAPFEARIAPGPNEPPPRDGYDAARLLVNSTHVPRGRPQLVFFTRIGADGSVTSEFRAPPPVFDLKQRFC